MKEFDCNILKQHGFHDSLIEKIWTSQSGRFYLKGVFDEWEYTQNTGCKYYYFWFSGVTALELSEDETDYTDSSVIEFKASHSETGYDVSLAMEGVGDNNVFAVITFTCKDIQYDFYKYKGKSYQNMYNDARYQKFRAKMQEAYQEKYFLKAETKELGNGYTLKVDSYSSSDFFIEKHFLMRAEMVQFQYDSTYRMTLKAPVIIKHQNGRQYFLFKIDLYGISVYDMKDKTVFHYIPEGCPHHYQQTLGESFIITNIHYDSVTNLIAYEGCYWAGTNDVMVGDFSNPMNFACELKSMHEMVDPEYELYDDIDFGKWEDGKLHLLLDMHKEKVVDVRELCAENKSNS